MLKILHTADWHLGNFPAPVSNEKQNLRYLDICSYIEYLIASAEKMQPDIIIIAGDIFHQAKTWSDRGLQETKTITSYITKLSTIAPVCILRGTPNHDGKMHYDMLTTALHDNNSVLIVDEPCVENINDIAAIAFVPIFDKSQNRIDSDIPMDKEMENNYFSDKVRDAILDLKETADSYNLPTILVTHYTVLGCEMPNGQKSIFTTNDVTIDPITLTQADYWLTCLGHIHKPQKLENCPNTFYAGSLCGLTFNDEFDPHGFYMHYIKGYNDIQSEFIEIPSRKFYTLSFDDAALTDIISSDYDLSKYITTPMQGDIIRVIYTCKDTTNKVLNKALFEKALYAATNVFYIQEIVPAEIDITVDKTAMRNTTSVSDNLLSYLRREQSLHNSVTDEQINDCIALAQPIIDKVMADKTHNCNIGVFTPIEIEVHNYRNYQDAKFNYNDVKFCVINGENGAGKSSLFMDAMLDAMFEDTREGDITGWINNDINIRSGSIKFTFAIGSNIYRIVRTRQKSGKATLTIARYISDTNTWLNLSTEKLKDTQAVINDIVGMNPMTLKSCGLIMQDAYGLFLQADKNTRMDILADILSLDIYDELSAAVTEFGQTCTQNLSQITGNEDRINQNLADGQSLQAALDNIVNATQQLNEQLKQLDNEMLINTLKRENLTKNIDEYNRITNEINKLAQKKHLLSDNLNEQNNKMAEMYEIASHEPVYLEQIKRFNTLSEQEKAMSESSNQLKTLLIQKKTIDAHLNETQQNKLVLCNKYNQTQEAKTTVEQELLSADEINRNADLYETTKQEIANIEQRVEQMHNLEKERFAKEATIANLRNKQTALKVEYNSRLNEINKKIQLLNESGCPVVEQASCHFLADAKQAEKDKPLLESEFESLNSGYDSQISILNQEIENLMQTISQLQSDLPLLETKKKELTVYEQSALKKASLPEMKEKLSIYDKQLAEYNTAIIEADTQIANDIKSQCQLSQNINELSNAIIGYDDICTELAKFGDITAQGNNIAAAKTAINIISARINELIEELKVIDADIESQTSQRNELKIETDSIAIIDANILACNTQRDMINSNIAANNKTIGQLEQDIRKYHADVRELNNLKKLKETAVYIASNNDWLKKAFNRNGIPHHIVRSVIPVLQATASNILAQMSNNTMSIELKTEKVLTTKKEVATLDVIVCDTVTGNLPYLSRSGGERVKAALSMVLALAEIKASESGTQLGFLFIDEPPFLDSNGIDAYCDALEAIQQRYTNLKIMAITHDPEMKSRFSQSVDVTKTPRGSEIHTNL